MSHVNVYNFIFLLWSYHFDFYWIVSLTITQPVSHITCECVILFFSSMMPLWYFTKLCYNLSGCKLCHVWMCNWRSQEGHSFQIHSQFYLNWLMPCWLISFTMMRHHHHHPPLLEQQNQLQVSLLQIHLLTFMHLLLKQFKQLVWDLLILHNIT